MYACGSDYWGCLGQGQPVEQEQSYTVPVPVSLPDHLQVEQIACGDAHVVALTSACLQFYNCKLLQVLMFRIQRSIIMGMWRVWLVNNYCDSVSVVVQFMTKFAGRLGLGSEMNVSSPQKVIDCIYATLLAY